MQNSIGDWRIEISRTEFVENQLMYTELHIYTYIHNVSLMIFPIFVNANFVVECYTCTLAEQCCRLSLFCCKLCRDVELGNVVLIPHVPKVGRVMRGKGLPTESLSTLPSLPSSFIPASLYSHTIWFFFTVSPHFV